MAHKAKKNHSFKSSLNAFWKSKLFYVVGLIVLVLIGSNVVKEVVRQMSIQHDIGRLEYDIAQEKDRNSQISQLLQSLNSSSTLEKEARTKLGVQKEGETVVSLSDPQVTTTNPTQVATTIDTRSNMEKWIDSFLHK